MLHRKIIGAVGTLLILAGCAQQSIETARSNLTADTPLHAFKTRLDINTWIGFGPFDNTMSDTLLQDGTYDVGYSKDFLADLGGELNVELSTGDALGELKAVKLLADELNMVDLTQAFGPLESVVAYASALVYSEEKQEATLLLGSDDAVKVWLNGELVHANYTFRGVTPEEDEVGVTFQKGINRILVKVVNGVRGWGFSVSFVNQATQLQRIETRRAQEEMEVFVNVKVIPDWYNYWDETFNPGPFPRLRWEQPLLADKVLGTRELKVRWFDVDLNEVEEASRPGRYGYVAEAVDKAGKIIQRAGTLYCYPWDWMGWSDRPTADLVSFPAARFDKEKVAQFKDAIQRDVGRILLLSTLDQTEGAVLMAFLNEVDQGMHLDDPLATPQIMDSEFHLALQKKLGSIKYSGPGLERPTSVSTLSAPVLRSGTPAEAGFKSGVAEALQAVCDDWFAASREPFVTLVARNGVIVYHAATGEDETEVFTTRTMTPVASVTKLITGVTFAQFVHQGLVDIDDPLAEFFPGYPATGSKALTLRHCFTHTSGLVGHERWGGVHNPRLENIVANQLDFLKVGEVSVYNGDGYNLAGRVMEAISGKSIFRVINENLFAPLEMTRSIIEEDLAFSLNCNAHDLAKVGQLLLNRGSYGEYQLFSPEVFDAILPRNLSEFYPGMNWDQGIGLTWMNNRHPQAGQDGNPEDLTILSKNTIGHGSATSAILRVDLDNGLVITQSRRQGGAHYDQYLNELLLTISRNLE